MGAEEPAFDLAQVEEVEEGLSGERLDCGPLDAASTP